MGILKPYVKHSSSHSAVFDGTPRTRIDIKATSGALDGEASSKANKAKVLYGIPRDPDVAAALAELEDEENESNAEDEKPKVGHVNTISCDFP